MVNEQFVQQQEDLANAITALGVNIQSLTEFLHEAIEAAESVQYLHSDTSSRQINEAKLLHYILRKRCKPLTEG